VEVGYRRTDSNDPLVTYRGPLVTVRAGAGAPGEVRLAAYAAYGRREYDDYPVLFGSGVDVGVRRVDETWRWGMDAERDVSSRARAFVAVSVTHQTSNIDELAFDQVRLLAGAEVALWSRPGGSRSSSAERIPDLIESWNAEVAASMSLGPTRLADGIRFRCRAPRAAAVALVGGFNRWDPAVDLLDDADGDGVWETTVAVPAGVWRYAFVVDGEWIRPEGAQRYEDDGFGGTNGILEVPAAERPR
jgi:hypothetical protein